MSTETTTGAHAADAAGGPAYLFSVCLTDGTCLGSRWIHTAHTGTDAHQAWTTAAAVAAVEARDGETAGTVHAISCHPALTGYAPESLERTWPEAFAHNWGGILIDADGTTHHDWADAGPLTLTRAVPLVEYRTLGERSGSVEDDPVVRPAAAPSSVAGCPVFFEEHESAEGRACPTDSVCDEPDEAQHPPVLPGGAYRVRWVFRVPLGLEVTALGEDPVGHLLGRDDVVVHSRTDFRRQALTHPVNSAVEGVPA
ncbi:hypothetical protein [Kocuria dechangensis]|nr:hypothetical protein [Kocuria dechangensis]